MRGQPGVVHQTGHRAQDCGGGEQRLHIVLVDDVTAHRQRPSKALAEEVHALLVPMQPSWSKTSQAIDFTQAVAPRLALGIHDAQVNDRGYASVDGRLAEESATDYRWLPAGTTLQIDRSADRRSACGTRCRHAPPGRRYVPVGWKALLPPSKATRTRTPSSSGDGRALEFGHDDNAGVLLRRLGAERCRCRAVCPLAAG